MLSIRKVNLGNTKSYLRDTHPELRTQFVRALDKRNSKFDELSSCSNARCIWQCTEQIVRLNAYTPGKLPFQAVQIFQPAAHFVLATKFVVAIHLA